MKINFKFLIYLPIILLFLPSFSFYIPGLKVFEFYFVSLYIALIFMFIQNYSSTINRIRNIALKTPLVYYLLFLLFIIINSIILSIFGTTTLAKTFTAVLFKFILGILPSIFYFICLIPRYISLKNFIQLFLKLLWISLILGIVAYLGRWFDISIINNLFDFFANSRHISAAISSYNPDAALYFEYGKRLTGLHAEPGYLGQFLYLFLPFIYSFSVPSLNLFTNKYLNIVCKNTLISLTWINIILTKSPITLILSLFISILYYRKSIINFVRKSYLLIAILLISIYLIFINIDFSSTYIGRILKVIQCLKSYELFVIAEPSLATRISSFINEFCIFLQHPITGVGFENLGNYVYTQLLRSPVPLTEEIIFRNIDAINRFNSAHLNKGFIYTILAENGIIAGIILMYSYLKTFSVILKSNNFYKKFEFNYLLLKSLKYSLLCILILFVYDLYLVNKFYNLLLSLSFIVIYTKRICLNKNKKSMRCLYEK